MGAAADDLAPLVARVLLAGVVDLDDAPIVHRADRDGAGAGPERGRELGLRHAQRALRLDPLGDVVGHAPDDGHRYAVGSERAAKLPHPAVAAARHDGQEPACDAVSLEPVNVSVEPVPGLRCQQLADVELGELVGRVPEDARRRVVDRENPAVEVVCAEQIFAVLDEVAIAVFAIAQRPLHAAAFVDFRLQHSVLVEGLTLAAEALFERPPRPREVLHEEQHHPEADAVGADHIDEKEQRPQGGLIVEHPRERRRRPGDEPSGHGDAVDRLDEAIHQAGDCRQMTGQGTRFSSAPDKHHHREHRSGGEGPGARCHTESKAVEGVGQRERRGEDHRAGAERRRDRRRPPRPHRRGGRPQASDADHQERRLQIAADRRQKRQRADGRAPRRRQRQRQRAEQHVQRKRGPRPAPPQKKRPPAQPRVQ